MSNDNVLLDNSVVGADFSQYIKIIAHATGIKIQIDISKQSKARIVPGNDAIYFNPEYTISVTNKWVEKQLKDSDFSLNLQHLTFLIIHDIDKINNDIQLRKKEINHKGKIISMKDYKNLLIMENGIDFLIFSDLIEDIIINNYITKLQAPILETSKQELYKYLCTPNSDLTKLPLYKQFTLGILREIMLPKEKTEVSPLVREIINCISISGGLLSKINDINLEYSNKFYLIEKLFTDYYLRLQNKENEEESENFHFTKEENIKSPSNEESLNESDNKENKDTPLKGEDKKAELPKIFVENDEAQENNEESKGDNGEIEEERKNNIKVIKQIEKAILENMKTPEEISLESSIKQEWGDVEQNEMEKIKSNIRWQEKLRNQILTIKDKNGNSVFDEIVNDIFNKIVESRKDKTIQEESPRPLSEGGQFSNWHFVQGIIDGKAGDYDPPIMQQEILKEKEKKKTGSFSITLILDGSSSMTGEKNRQQMYATLLILYAIEELKIKLHQLENFTENEFLIDSQVMMFKGNHVVDTLKLRGTEITKKEIINITRNLGYCNGDTNGTDAILKYYNQISSPFNGMSSSDYEERKKKIQNGEKKEILFVLSDGGFNSGGDPKFLIKQLREIGVIVCGIGITEDGLPMVNLFGKKNTSDEENKLGYGLVCKNVRNLSQTLKSLLMYHLKDYN